MMDVYRSMDPGSDMFSHNVLEGHQPYNRTGEIIATAFADRVAYQNQMQNALADNKVAFHHWATVTPGVICLHKNTSSRSRSALDEHAMAVVTSADNLDPSAANHENYTIAGVVRSKSTTDEMSQRSELFTLTIGGVVTVVNTNDKALYPGDGVAWTFKKDQFPGSVSSQSGVPKRIQIEKVVTTPATQSNESRKFGVVMRFSKPGEPVDVKLSF